MIILSNTLLKSNNYCEIVACSQNSRTILNTILDVSICSTIKLTLLILSLASKAKFAHLQNR